MQKRFLFGFALGLLFWLIINGITAHLASDCGLPAVLGVAACADDIVRAGWPLRFYEDGGFAYRHFFSLPNLLLDLGGGVLLAGGFGWWFARRIR